MKRYFKIAGLLTAIILAFVSCSTIKKLPTTVAGASRARFVGVWTLTKVSYQNLLQGAVQNIFNQVSPDDFVGSTWKLTNSGNGVFTLTNGTSQTIFWAYNDKNGINNEIFQFKKLFQGDSAAKIDDGYQLEVASIDGSSMILKLPVRLGDKTAYVVLSFIKIK